MNERPEGRLKLKTAPATYPLTEAEVWQHLKVGTAADPPETAEQTLINRLLKAATNHAENYLNRALITQTWYYYLDDLYLEFEIPKSKIASITSIKYYDEDNEQQTLDSAYYDVDLISEPARIIEAHNYIYPSVYDKQNAVEVEFICGYGDADDVPDEIKAGMLLYVTHLYEHRGDEGFKMPYAIDVLWKNHKVYHV